MVELNLFRDKFCCFSLRTACFIFATFQAILFLLFCVLLIFINLTPFIWPIAVTGEILLIPLFYGLYKEQQMFLFPFIMGATILAGFIALMCSASLLAAFIVVLGWLRDNSPIAIQLTILLSVAIPCGVGLLFLLMSLLVVRNYQMQLQRRKMERETEIEDNHL